MKIPANTRSALSIDPGYEHYAFAYWNLQNKGIPQLIACGIERGTPYNLGKSCYSRFARGRMTGYEPHLIIEEMVVYNIAGVRGEQPNDLIKVATTSGMIAANFEKTLWLAARSWKGQVKKEMTRDRVIDILGYDPSPKMEGATGKQCFHVFDALGIGLNAFGLYR